MGLKQSICPEKLTSMFDVKHMLNKVNGRTVGTEKGKTKTKEDSTAVQNCGYCWICTANLQT